MTLSPRKLIQYHCWECLGHYEDGKIDCENITCPLYQLMPYRKLEPDQSFQVYNPRAQGKKIMEKRIMSQEEKDQLIKTLHKNK